MTSLLPPTPPIEKLEATLSTGDHIRAASPIPDLEPREENRELAAAELMNGLPVGSPTLLSWSIA
jgi:hypothetical protein